MGANKLPPDVRLDTSRPFEDTVHTFIARFSYLAMCSFSNVEILELDYQELNQEFFWGFEWSKERKANRLVTVGLLALKQASLSADCELSNPKEFLCFWGQFAENHLMTPLKQEQVEVCYRASAVTVEC